MNIKKTLTLLFVLVASSITALAVCPDLNGSYSSKQQEYLCRRYITITQDGAVNKFDFAQVQQVFYDKLGYAQHRLTPKPPWNASATAIYVVFNNGNWMLFSSGTATPNPATAWDAYRDFLIENPSFIGMR